MAIYYVNGKEIDIPTHKKPFGFGSEGNLYLIGDKLYKIYNSESLNEGFGNKQTFHQSLLGLNDKYKSFVLPETLIFDEQGQYVGYVAPLVDNQKNSNGVTGLEWDKFISNLRNLEIETDMLGQDRFLLIDLAYHNSIFNRTNEKLYMVDPGRYRHYSYFTITDYKSRNNVILTDYFKNMLRIDLNYFKLMHKNKIYSLVNTISNEVALGSYSYYFEKQKDNYESIHEFLQVKARFTK